MQWIGGPSKDLGEKEGAGKFAAVGSTGSSRLEGAASQGALRQAQGGKGKGGGGEEPLTSDGVKNAVQEAMSEQQGSGGGKGKDQSMGEKKA